MATGSGRFPIISKTGKATMAGLALDLAIRALRSDAVQKQLADAPGVVLGQVRARRAARPAATPTDVVPAAASTTTAPAGRDPRRRVGQRALERRSRRLRETMRVLTADAGAGVALTEAATRVDAALDSIDRQLVVAKALPLVKRTRAHLAIDRDLGRLEKALWRTVRDDAP